VLGGAGRGGPAAGGQYRFVAGTGQSTVIPAAKRGAAPDVQGELLDGAPFRLSDLRGMVVVLNFWGSWCAPCRAEAPELETVYQQTTASGVAFVGVNIKDDRQLAVAFARSRHVTYPSLYDPAGRVALRFRNYPPNAIPSTIVLDRQGRVTAVFLRPLLRGDLLAVVRQVAREPE
jgi:thiol-disulfide isomerase/thioredoxin